MMYWSSLLVASASLLVQRAAADYEDCTGINAVKPTCKSQEAAYHRDVFFVGGHFVPSGATDSVLADQLYVEKLTPVTGLHKPYPLVFISAGVPSSTVWLNTPDNRQGFASYFVQQGYQVYIVDIASNGRSGQADISRWPLRAGSSVVVHESGFTAPERFNQYPSAVGHTQWPGNGSRGDPVFDAFFAATLPLTSNNTALELAMRHSGCELLSLVGPSFLIAHSNGNSYTALMADECPSKVRALLNLEPGNIPFQSFVGEARTRTRPWGLTYTPLSYDPPINNVTADLIAVESGIDTPELRSCFIQAGGSPRKLTNIAKVPYVMFTAANSQHTHYDHCFIEYLDQAGVKDITWVKFGDLGIKGNAHFFFLEKNNQELVKVVQGEIEKRN